MPCSKKSQPWYWWNMSCNILSLSLFLIFLVIPILHRLSCPTSPFAPCVWMDSKSMMIIVVSLVPLDVRQITHSAQPVFLSYKTTTESVRTVTNLHCLRRTHRKCINLPSKWWNLLLLKRKQMLLQIVFRSTIVEMLLRSGAATATPFFVMGAARIFTEDWNHMFPHHGLLKLLWRFRNVQSMERNNFCFVRNRRCWCVIRA